MKTGLIAYILFFLFATSSAHAAVTITPGAPISIQNYANQLAAKISPDFDINIAATGAPDAFNVSVSRASGVNQTLKSVTYEVRIITGIVTVTSSTIRADFFAGTPVTYTGTKLFDGVKMIFPASDPIAEISQMFLRSKNNPAVDEVNFQSRGRYWKIYTNTDENGGPAAGIVGEEDTVDDMHVHTGTTVSDGIKHAEHEKMIELVKYADVTDRIVKSGNWSDASIWENGFVPQTGSRVFVAEGLTITIDGEFMAQVPFTVRIDGVIRFKTDVNTGLKVRTFVVNSMGAFYMGEADSTGKIIDRIRPGMTSQILIADRGIRDDAARLRDPLDLDGGIIAHGKLFNMFGEEKTGHAIPIETLNAGLIRISFSEAPKGWHLGDTLVFPTTSDEHTDSTGKVTHYWNFSDEDELIQIGEISADGKMITLTKALQYSHLAPAGVKDPKNPGRLLAIPVGNLTRNAFFKSEISSRAFQAVLDGDPETGRWIREVTVNDLQRRGHFMVMHAQSGVLIDGAGFYDLGRTNARMNHIMTVHTIPVLDNAGHVIPGTDLNTIGRYALHFHGRTGSNADNINRVSNCAITGSPKHGLVNHGGNIIVSGNVTYDIDGSHFFAENGSEIGAFIHNLAIGSKGLNTGSDGFMMTGAFNQLTNNGTLYAFDAGGNGFGFWMQGHGIRVLDNYAFHHRNSAFAYYALGLKEGLRDCNDMSCAEWLSVPYIEFPVANIDVRDADGNEDSEKLALKNKLKADGIQSIPIQAVPVTFARNVGATSPIGLFASYIQTSITQNSYYSKIQDSVFWANTTYGINDRYSRRVHFQNITLIREPSGINLARNPGYPTYGGGFGGNEHTQYIIFDQVHVEGYNGGISMPFYGDNEVRDSFLKNRMNILIPAPMAEGNIVGFDPGDSRHITIQNVHFEELKQRGYSNEPSYDIYFRGRFIHDNPAEGPDPTPWYPDRNLVEIIGQDVSSLRIGSDYVPYNFDRFFVVLCENEKICPGSPAFSKKFTNQLTNYVAVVKKAAYPISLLSPVIYSAPLDLHEGWNFIPVTISGYTLDCEHDLYGCTAQEKFVMVFGDATPPVFVPDPQIPLTIDSNRLGKGFLLMGDIIDEVGNIKTKQNFSRNFTNLTVEPDGKVWLRSSALSDEERKALKDRAGNTAEFEIPLNVIISTYTITANAGAGGTITPSGTVSVQAGADQAFTITANQGYAIDDIAVSGVSFADSDSCDGKNSFASPYTYTFTNVTAAQSIYAAFSQITYRLNVTTAGTGTGSVTVDPKQDSYAAGTVVQLTATPDTSSTFTGWTIGNSIDTANPLSITMNAHQNITANFAIKTYTIYSLTWGGGTITPSGLRTYEHGSSPTYTIKPSLGYTIKDVFVDGVSQGPVSTYKFSQIEDGHTILALFSPITYVLNVSTVGTGTGKITKNPDQASYAAGTVVQLTATPDTSSAFTGWTIGDSTETANPLSITMNADQSVTANFKVIIFANPTDAQILADMEKVIRDYSSGFGTPPEQRILNFDLNSDGNVDATDQIIMRNLWSLGYDDLMAVANKFMKEVITRMMKTKDDPLYILEFDSNKDGVISPIDYLRIGTALTRWSNRTDLAFVRDMEKVIRDHPYTSLSGSINPFPGFDLNSDGNVNSTDVILMRNIWTLPYEKFASVLDKFMQEVSKSVGTKKGDPGYIFEFDADKNGTITAAADRGRILLALRHGRT